MNNRRRLLRIFFVFVFFGIITFSSLLSSPTWTNIRAVDILRLICTGMFLGGAIVSIGLYFRDRRTS